MVRIRHASGGPGAHNQAPQGLDTRRLRTTLLRRLKTQEEAERRRKSDAVRRKLLRRAVFRRAKTILCYVSLPYEVETWLLIEEMLESGKRVIVPVVQQDELILSELRDPVKDLAPGAFGVWEPHPRAIRPMRPEALDLVLVPGLAFDRRGQRLGHGQGYFDRLLTRLPKTTPTMGLCFDFQLVDYLPTHPHDQRVHTVLAA